MLEFTEVDPNKDAAVLFTAVHLASALTRVQRREEGGKGVWTTVIYHDKTKILEKLLAGECGLAWASLQGDGSWHWTLAFGEDRLSFQLSHGPEWLKARPGAIPMNQQTRVHRNLALAL